MDRYIRWDIRKTFHLSLKITVIIQSLPLAMSKFRRIRFFPYYRIRPISSFLSSILWSSQLNHVAKTTCEDLLDLYSSLNRCKRMEVYHLHRVQDCWMVYLVRVDGRDYLRQFYTVIVLIIIVKKEFLLP
uniref:Uncharacterized protein n=1 Tax=Cacopsylla melanoneura TaxID=428564 RepID=A0A8D8SA13_9HEMI